MNNSLSIIKKILSVATIILLFFSWFSYSASAAGVSAGFSGSGFTTIGADIVPIFLIILLVKGGDSEQTKKLYLYASIVGIIITILVALFYPSILKMIKVSGVSQKVSWGIGFWLSLIVYVALLVVSIIDIKKSDGLDSDNPVMESGDGIKNTAKSVAGKVQGTVKDIAFVECSNCGNKVVKGKKFCGKCGNPMTQFEETNQTTGNNQSIRGVKCPNCGKQLSNDAVFCDACGTKIEIKTKPTEIICSSCGEKLSDDAKFCIKCGTKIGE